MRRYVVSVLTKNPIGYADYMYWDDFSNLDSAFYEIHKLERQYRVMGRELNYRVYDRKDEIAITKEDYYEARKKEDKKMRSMQRAGLPPNCS